MNTTDIHLFETGSGGDFAIVNEDLLMGESLYQQIYLALFGGNIEASTKQSYLESEERFDYWGNSLIWNTTKTKQFNSETERIIQNTTLYCITKKESCFQWNNLKNLYFVAIKF